jgi:uncharacterized protein YdeI (YjbR/CyaY-like superfamily)
MNPKVDAFLSEAEKWREEMTKLRRILLDCGLTEEFKWSKPCYTYNGGIVVVIQGFKAYCALLFFKGVLLKDPNHILVKTGENTVVGRQIRFTNVRDVVGKEAFLKAYIRQAIEVEKAGLKVDSKPAAKLKIPKELQNKMDEIPALKTAFKALTPGRQKAYVFFISGAKQSQTRAARVEKWIPQILKGRGMNDDYASLKKKSVKH